MWNDGSEHATQSYVCVRHKRKVMGRGGVIQGVLMVVGGCIVSTVLNAKARKRSRHLGGN